MFNRGNIHILLKNAKFDIYCYDIIQSGKTTEVFLPKSQNLDSKFSSQLRWDENWEYYSTTEISNFSVNKNQSKILKTWKVTKSDFVSDQTY